MFTTKKMNTSSPGILRFRPKHLRPPPHTCIPCNTPLGHKYNEQSLRYSTLFNLVSIRCQIQIVRVRNNLLYNQCVVFKCKTELNIKFELFTAALKCVG